MKQRAFLTAMVVAFAVAAAVVWLRSRSEPETPAAHQESGQTASTCTLTECRISPVITPALQMSSSGKNVVGVWNVARSSQSVLEMQNVSDEAVVISGLTLSMCLNDQITPVADVPRECQYVKIVRSDYGGKKMTLKPGETCSTTLETDAHGQIARIQFDTTRGPVILMITVQ